MEGGTDLLSGICDLDWPREIPKSFNDPVISDFCGKITFPGRLFEDIRKNWETVKQFDCEAILVKYGFSFPVPNEVLDHITSYSTVDLTEIDNLALVSFCAALQWRIDRLGSKNFDRFQSIVQCIVSFGCHSKFPIAFPLFVDLVQLYAKFETDACVEFVLEKIFDVAKLNVMVLKKLEPQLLVIIKKMLPLPSSVLTEEAKRCLGIIMNMHELFGLEQSTGRALVEWMSYHTDKLDTFCLTLFKEFMPLLRKEVIEENTLRLLYMLFLQAAECPFVNVTEKPETSMQMPEIGGFGDSEMTFIENIPHLELPGDSQYIDHEPIRCPFMDALNKVIDIALESDKAGYYVVNEYILDPHRGLSEAVVLMILLREIKINGDEQLELWNMLMNTVVMDENVTSFDNTEYSRIVGMLRRDLVDGFARNGLTKLPLMLKSLQNKPLLFADIIKYVYFSENRIDRSVYGSSTLIKTVSTSMVQWQKFHILSDEKNRKVIENTRQVLIGLVSRALETHADVWFSNMFFVPIFFANFFELPTRKFAMDALYTFLVSNCSFSDTFLRFLTCFVDVVKAQIPKVRHTKLLQDFFQPINMSLLHKSRVIYTISELCDFVPFVMQRLDGSTESHELFLELLQFISFNPQGFPVEVIKNTCARMNDPTYHDAIELKLLQIVAEKQRVAKSELFMFKSPAMLSTLLSNCHCEEEYKNLFQLLNTILSTSLSNCVEANRGGLDLAIIDYIAQNRDAETLSESVSLALNVLEIIHHVASSTTEVQKYLSLLVQLDNKRLPIFHSNVLRSMSFVASKRKIQPKAYLPIAPYESTVIVDSIPVKMIQDGYIISVWVYMERKSVSKQVKLLSLRDNHNCALELVIGSTSMSVVVEGVTTISSAKFTKELMPGSWTLISMISHRAPDTRWEIVLKINNQVSNEASSAWAGFVDDVVTLSVLLPAKNLEDKHFGAIGYIGELAMFPYSPDSQCHVNWQAMYPKVPEDAWLHMLPVERNNIVAIDVVSPLKGIKYRVEGTPARYILSFVDVLVRSVKIDALLPVFAQAGKTQLSGTTGNVCELAMDILISLGSTVVIDEQSLMNVMCVISALLLVCPLESLTYNLYQKLSTFCQPFSNKVAQKAFSSLLLNLNIWKRGGITLLDRVTRHWKRIFFPDYVNNFNFDYLLYCLSDVEDPRIMMNVFDCIVQYSMLNMTTKHFKALVGTCVVCTVMDTLYTYLTLIITIVQHKNPDDMASIDVSCIALLHNLVAYNDEKIFLAVIDIICLCGGSDKEQHFISMASLLGDKLMTKDILDKLLERKEPGLFHMECQIALAVHCEAEFLEKVPCMEMQESKIISLISLISNKSVEHLVFDKLIDSQTNLLVTVASLELFCKATMRPSCVLDYLYRYLLKCPLPMDIPQYEECMSCIYQFLLFIDTEEHVRRMNQVMYGTEPSQPQTPTNMNMVTSLMAAMVSVRDSSFNYQLGLRIDQNRGWLDLDLAKLCCLHFSAIHNEHSKFLCQDLVLCSFILRFDQAFVRLHVNLIKELIPKNQDLFQLIAVKNHLHQMAINGLPDPDPQIALNVMKDVDKKMNLEPYMITTRENLARIVDSIRRKKLEFATHVNRKIDTKAVLRRDKLIQTLGHQAIYNRMVWRKVSGVLCSTIWKPLSAGKTIQHFQRDSTLCGARYSVIPAKLKVNKHFDDHIIASYARDTGSLDRAKQIVEQMKQMQGRKEGSSTRSISSPKRQKIPANARLYSAECILISCNKERPCTFIIMQNSIVLKLENRDIVIPLELIRAIVPRTQIHIRRACEIFTFQHVSYLLLFESPAILQNIWKTAKVEKDLVICTKDWLEGNMTNFDYLMNLNLASGRSFNNMSQYPFVPWIIQDYESETLDLSNPATFRDLSRPMGSLDKAFCDDAIGRHRVCNFMYCSGPMTPAILYRFLIRMEPFTTLHINFQSGRFDAANRIFSSVALAYRQAMIAEPTELCPEFFYLPEFLVNKNGFSLGLEGSGDVILPKWAKNAVDFIYQHRKALESDYVSENLHKWIDLFFGIAQNDPDRLNVYPPYLYDNFDETKHTMNSKELEIALSQCGQIPYQIFTKPHPVRSLPRLESAIHQQTSLALGAQVVASLVEPVPQGAMLHVYTDQGSIKRYKVTFSKDNVDIREKDAVKFKGKSAFTNKAQFLTAKHVIDVDQNNHKISLISLTNSSIQRSSSIFGEIKSVCIDRPVIMVIGDDATATFFRMSSIEEPLFILESSHGEYVCGKVGSSHDLAVLGTASGFLDIVSIRRKGVVMTVEIPGEIPHDILISQSLGFIMVHSVSAEGVKNHLTLFTVNGEKIGSYELTGNHQILSMTSFVDRKGFDHALIQVSSGAIMEFEMYYMKPNVLVRTVGNEGSVHFLKSHNVVMHLATNGKITFVPFVPV